MHAATYGLEIVPAPPTEQVPVSGQETQLPITLYAFVVWCWTRWQHDGWSCVPHRQ